jgi:hypothetical protein
MNVQLSKKLIFNKNRWSPVYIKSLTNKNRVDGKYMT